MPQWFNTQEELDQAVKDLKSLGPAALRLLRECVQETTLTRTKISKSAESLYDCGFIHIRYSHWRDDPATLSASLWGEEVLETLENLCSAK